MGLGRFSGTVSTDGSYIMDHITAAKKGNRILTIIYIIYIIYIIVKIITYSF